MEQRVENNVQKIMQAIDGVSGEVGRDPATICPIVVTKNRTDEEIQTMYRLGFRHFAENRVEKLIERQASFPQSDIIWHLIGPLQKRKVKTIINAIHYFHAVDRLSILDEIEKRAEHSIQCFVEVNVSGEATKHGFTVEECLASFEYIQSYRHIQIVGLMTMAPINANEEELQRYFSTLASVATTLQKQHKLEQPLLLSMGMSNDFQAAIRAGATHIRIGTAWFE